MVALSPIQQIAAARKTTGKPFYLRLGEELIESNISDTSVMLMIRTVTIKEYVVGYKVTAQGTRLIICKLETDGEWSVTQMTNWDETFRPYEVGTRGGKSESEYREQVAWEDDCYRPGNGTRLGQRDNADRVAQGYDYTRPQFYSTTTRKR